MAWREFLRYRLLQRLFRSLFRLLDKKKEEKPLDNYLEIVDIKYLQVSKRKVSSRNFFLSNRGGMPHLTCKSFCFGVL